LLARIHQDLLDNSGGIGTSFDQVDRVVSENPADTLLAFFDLGSAIKC
ncbi:TPA: PTS mannose family transporter subunit IIA, partial [Streptococcus pneumoniae]|nr:PTS mannose family transporter subunit IIA [Streptococcus pneumoniae]